MLSSRKLLDSSKLEPKLESEHEIQRDLLLPTFDPKFPKLLGGLLKGSVELVMDTLGRNMFVKLDVAVILRSNVGVNLGSVNKLVDCEKFKLVAIRAG